MTWKFMGVPHLAAKSKDHYRGKEGKEGCKNWSTRKPGMVAGGGEYPPGEVWGKIKCPNYQKASADTWGLTETRARGSRLRAH